MILLHNNVKMLMDEEKVEAENKSKCSLHHLIVIA
jgi:hypothetical protein